MAVKHTQIKGTYNQKSKDSNTQDPRKFGNSFHKPTDVDANKRQPINKPKDSGSV